MSGDTSNEVCKVLWTGGWDSTFRVLQLAREGRDIQPYYILAAGRTSISYELAARQAIQREISKKYPACDIRDTVFLELRPERTPPETVAAFRSVREHADVGDQIMWFSMFDTQLDGVELCTEKSRTGGHYLVIQGYLQDEPKFMPAAERLVSHLSFPLLSYTKTDMANEAKEHAEMEIMNMSWFCYTPINGRPCGTCRPCGTALQYGLAFRLGRKAKLYARAPNFINALRRLVQKFL